MSHRSEESALWQHSERCVARRRWVAFLGHAPGLYFASGQGLPRALWRPQAIAAGATVAAMLAGALVISPWWLGTGAAWLIGHLSWSTYLSRRVGASAAGPCRGPLGCDDDCGPS